MTGVNQRERGFFFFFFSKAKQSERSSRVNEYAVCCHALFLYPAVVRGSGKGEELFFKIGAPWRLLHPQPPMMRTIRNICCFRGTNTHRIVFSRAFRLRRHEQPLSVATRHVTKCTARHVPIQITQTYSRQRRVGINFERRRCQVHKRRMD